MTQCSLKSLDVFLLAFLGVGSGFLIPPNLHHNWNFTISGKVLQYPGGKFPLPTHFFILKLVPEPLLALFSYGDTHSCEGSLGGLFSLVSGSTCIKSGSRAQWIFQFAFGSNHVHSSLHLLFFNKRLCKLLFVCPERSYYSCKYWDGLFTW